MIKLTEANELLKNTYLDIVNTYQHTPFERKIEKQTNYITPKTGRNKPCPCGSGLKFKNCCLNKEVKL